MKNTKCKHLLALIILIAIVFSFATGCAIIVNIGTPSNNTTETASATNPAPSSSICIYQSKATILISRSNSDKNSVSSSDLTTSKGYADAYVNIFQSDTVQDEIRDEFPDVEYELTLEPTNETDIFTIFVTGSNPECLEEICNMALSVFCENVANIVVGTSCKVVDLATPAQQVGTN